MNRKYKIAFLGTGTCSSTSRNPASFVISDGEKLTAVDFGGGAYHQLSRLEDDDFHPDKLKNLMLTHYHIDHISGIPDLIWGKQYSPLENRTAPLNIYGPKGLTDFWENRLTPFINKTIDINFELHEITGNSQINLGEIKVFPTAMDHTLESTAYSFEIDGKTITFTGDTNLNENLISLINRSDIVITEWSFTNIQDRKKKHLDNKSILKLFDVIRNDCDLYFTHIYPEKELIFKEQTKKIKKIIANSENKCFFPEDLLVIEI